MAKVFSIKIPNKYELRKRVAGKSRRVQPVRSVKTTYAKHIKINPTTSEIIHRSGIKGGELNQLVCSLFDVYVSDNIFYGYQKAIDYFGTRCCITVGVWSILLTYEEAKKKINDEDHMYRDILCLPFSHSCSKKKANVITIYCKYPLDHILMIIKDDNHKNNWLVIDSRIREKFYCQWINDIDKYVEQYSNYKHNEENYKNLLCRTQEFDPNIKWVSPKVNYCYIRNALWTALNSIDKLLTVDFDQLYKQSKHKNLADEIISKYKLGR